MSNCLFEGTFTLHCNITEDCVDLTDLDFSFYYRQVYDRRKNQGIYTYEEMSENPFITLGRLIIGN